MQNLITLVNILEVINEPFFVISVQNYYETPNHDYMPAEIGLVEFSLMKGIINQYNVILKPSQLQFVN